jgi:hypothetical protein
MRRMLSYTRGVNLSSAALSPCRHSISKPVTSSVETIVIGADSNIGGGTKFSLSAFASQEIDKLEFVRHPMNTFARISR